MVKTALSSNNVKIGASGSGIYVYSSVIQTPFNIVNALKKFIPEEHILNLLKLPMFSNKVSRSPWAIPLSGIGVVDKDQWMLQLQILRGQ